MYNFQNSEIATGATLISVFFCTNSQMYLHFYIPIIKLNNPFEIASAVHPRCKLFFPLTLLQHSLWSVVVVIVQYLSLYTNEKFSSELFATRPRVANNGGDHPDRKKKMKRAKLETTGANNFWGSILVFIKVQLFWGSHKNLKAPSWFDLYLVGDYSNFLWPSQKR